MHSIDFFLWLKVLVCYTWPSLLGVLQYLLHCISNRPLLTAMSLCIDHTLSTRLHTCAAKWELQPLEVSRNSVFSWQYVKYLKCKLEWINEGIKELNSVKSLMTKYWKSQKNLTSSWQWEPLYTILLWQHIYYCPSYLLRIAHIFLSFPISMF